jgi:hypothetical protein
MPRNGSGDFELVTNSWQPAINGVLATAGDWQSLINDVAAAITQSVSRDGQSPLTGNLQLGNNKITGVTAGAGTGEALAFQQLFNQGTMADIASAATTDIGLQNTNFLRVTGTTTITSFGSNYRGPRFLVFAGAVTLTNSATLVLPGGANITTAAGDVLIAIPGATLGTADKWIVTAYQKNTSVTNPNFDALQVAGNNISASSGFSFKNRLINANPIINQRSYVSGTATSGANQYTLDRWRVVTSGQNVSWTDSGLTRTLTCPAGGLEQVIESLNIEGGTFVLNWTGTATATVNGTAVLKNGTFTLPANTNATVKFSSGTLSNPQLEAGSVATPFERRDYGSELIMCQRYYQQAQSGFAITGGTTQTEVTCTFPLKVEMRADPTAGAATIPSGMAFHRPGVAFYNITAINGVPSKSGQGYSTVTIAAGAGNSTSGQITSGPWLTAEL